jgi:hypothetical protein
VVIGDDVLEVRRTGNGMGSQQSRHDRPFDAAGVESAVGPVSGNGEIVIGPVERRNAAAPSCRGCGSHSGRTD